MEPIVCEHLRKVTIESMEQENDKEFWITLNNENDFKEYTNKNLPVGLTVSFDIGWNKCSSSNRYVSMSGHSLLIGFYPKRWLLLLFLVRCTLFVPGKTKQ